jgi:acyl carrier protein
MKEESPVETRIRSELREYIVVTWLSGDGRGLADDTDLQQAGILDSFSTMALIAHLEQAFQVQLEPADVTAETFRSLDSIARLILDRFPTRTLEK